MVKNVKVMWNVHGQNQIYVDMFTTLGKCNPNLELVMTASDKVKLLIDNENNRYFQTKQMPRGHFILSHLLYFKGLRKFLEEVKPDVVVVNTFYRISTWQAAGYCKKYGVPLLLQTEIHHMPKNILMNMMARLSLRFSRRLFNQAKFILPWTKDGVLFGRKYFGANNRDKIRLLSAGVDTELFYPVKDIQDKRDDSVFKILIVARLVPYKRHIDLLKALSFYRGKNYRLTICGKGALKDKIMRQAEKLCINARFIENVPRKKMKELYGEHDVVVLPSDEEAIGMVVLEAIACGLPVIVSDTVGAKMYVDGSNVMVFKTFDYIDLSARLYIVGEMKEYLSVKFEDAYNIDNVAKRFDKFIEECIRQ